MIGVIKIKEDDDPKVLAENFAKKFKLDYLNTKSIYD